MDKSGDSEPYGPEWVKSQNPTDTNTFVRNEGPTNLIPPIADIAPATGQRFRRSYIAYYDQMMFYRGAHRTNMPSTVEDISRVHDTQMPIRSGSHETMNDLPVRPVSNNTSSSSSTPLDPRILSPGTSQGALGLTQAANHQDQDLSGIAVPRTEAAVPQHQDMSGLDGMGSGSAGPLAIDEADHSHGLKHPRSRVEGMDSGSTEHLESEVPGGAHMLTHGRIAKKPKIHYHEDGDTVLVEPISSSPQAAPPPSESQLTGQFIQDTEALANRTMSYETPDQATPELDIYRAETPPNEAEDDDVVDSSPPQSEDEEEEEYVSEDEEYESDDDDHSLYHDENEEAEDDVAQTESTGVSLGAQRFRGPTSLIGTQEAYDPSMPWVSTTRAQYRILAANPGQATPVAHLASNPVPASTSNPVPTSASSPVDQAPFARRGPPTHRGLSSGLTDNPSGSHVAASEPAGGQDQKPPVTKFPALRVQTVQEKVEKLSAAEDLYVEWNEQEQKLAVVYNKITKFSLDLGQDGPTKVIHSTALQWFYAELRATGLGLDDEAGQVLFKMQIPKDESETIANFLNLLTSRIHDDHRVAQQDDDPYFAKLADLLDNRRARDDEVVNELLSPAAHLQELGQGQEGTATPAEELARYTSFPGLQNTDIDQDERLVFNPEGNAVGRLGEGRFAAPGQGDEIPFQPEWIRALGEHEQIQVNGDNIVVIDVDHNIRSHHPLSTGLVSIPLRKLENPYYWGTKGFSEWARKERDGLTYKILCGVRVEVNDLVVWVRDGFEKNYGIESRLQYLDGPFKIVAVDSITRSIKLALPNGSKANPWQPVDRFTPVRMNPQSEPLVIAQDAGAGPYPIDGAIKLPVANRYTPVVYFPAEHVQVVNMVPNLVFSRKITAKGHPPYDRNEAHRARYHFKFAWWPTEDQDWAPNTPVSQALVAEYNRQNPLNIILGTVEGDPGFE